MWVITSHKTWSKVPTSGPTTTSGRMGRAGRGVHPPRARVPRPPAPLPPLALLLLLLLAGGAAAGRVLGGGGWGWGAEGPPLPLPEQVHLTPGATFEAVTAQWVLQTRDPKLLKGCLCLYGPAGAPAGARRQAPAAPGTYSDDGFAGTILTAELGGLAAGATYSYTCGCTDGGAFSPARNFTAGHRGDFDVAGRAVKVLCWGDMGAVGQGVAIFGRDSKWVVQGLTRDAARGYELAINVGDSGYADDYQHPNAWVTDKWFNDMEGVMARVPTAFVPGNHEAQYNFAPYRQRMKMPAGGAGDLAPYLTSFDWGPLHVVGFSSEHSTRPGGEQWTFLLNDLKRVNREVTPFVVVFAHRPMYCTSMMFSRHVKNFQRCTTEAESLRDNLEVLFQDFGVDLYLSGHNHQYERSHPVFRARTTSVGKEGAGGEHIYVNPTATSHIVNGAAGDKEGNDPTWTGNPGWRAKHGLLFANGYARFEANMTALTWQYVEYAWPLMTEKVLDKFVLVKTSLLGQQ